VIKILTQKRKIINGVTSFALKIYNYKRMKKIVYILFLVFIVTACEEVIEVDLNDVNPVVVIEGNLTRSPSLTMVKVSKTSNYFGEPAVSKMVSNALVTIENDLGSKFILEEVEKGIYKSRDIYPQFGRTYKLTVEVDGEIYEAYSTLHPPVNIDSITYYYDEGFAFIDSGYYVKIYFSDPAKDINYYRVKVYKNGKYKNRLDNFLIFDDKIINGQFLEFDLRQRTYEIGQEAKVELITLDKGAYDYYNTFQELISVNPGSAAPANPTTNISNGAMGYFSAWSSDTKKVIIE
jgi:hypothetical protein